MPLHDHFHPPLSLRRHWTSFHNSWATYLSEDLNSQLPPGFFAEANAQFAIEIDVAVWEEPAAPAAPPADGGWTPGAPQLTLPFVLTTDVVEVRVFDTREGPALVGAVEIVSPSNKDRPESREAFVAKCANYLHQGVGLVIVDVVTERSANLHRQLLERVAPTAPVTETPLYAAAYRPHGRNGSGVLDVWQEALALGQPLPTVGLWLRGGPCLAVRLEATYDRTVRAQRVVPGGA